MRVASSAEVSPTVRTAGQGGWNTPFFGDAFEMLPGPQAFRIEMTTPGDTLRPHFHPVRQFQVVVGGSGKLGKHELKPVVFHYADPYTPYGPIVAGDDGLAFLTLRPEPTLETHVMPGARDQMRRKAGRNIARELGPRDGAGNGGAREALIPPDADGLQALRLCLEPGASEKGVDPAGSGGQYYLVTAGSLVTEGKELPLFSLLWVDPDELAPVLHAGAEGAELLLMQFPVADTATQPPRSHEATRLQRARTVAE